MELNPIEYNDKTFFNFQIPISGDELAEIYSNNAKHHTIRAGNRWKVGDKFSPRVWRHKPYNSPQVIIGADIEIKKVWDFESTGNNHLYINEKSINVFDVELLAKNDGLSSPDLLKWFKYPKPFKGQIICWNESIIY